MTRCKPLMTMLLALTAMSPAAAWADADSDCVYVGNRMQATAQHCGVGSGSVDAGTALSCLSTHETETGQVASFCVSAAESHYEQAAGLRGYAADRELMQGATYLGLAATANYFLGRRDLAISQLKSVIAIASRVKSDADAGDLAPAAGKEFTWASQLLKQLTTSR